MRLFALFAAALLAQAAAAKPSAHAAPSAEAVVKVAFPRGNPFPKHGLPELQLVDASTSVVVATVRAREWSQRLATYAAALPVGHTYGLRWANAEGPETFAELSLAQDVSGTSTFRLPYVPRSPAPLAQRTR